MRRNQIAKLSQNSELGCGWFGLSFFHLCRVTKLKSHANHFFLCFNRNSYGMAVKLALTFNQLKLDLRMSFNFAPILLDKFLLERAQHPPGRGHQIERSAPTQEREVFFTHNPAIEYPDPIQGPVLTFHRIKDLLQSRDICPITFKDLIRKRKSFFGHHQGQDDLQRVGSMISAVATSGDRYFTGLAFEIGAG